MNTEKKFTVHHQHAKTLTKEGIDTLYIVFNKGLGAFPKVPGFTEKALTTFMQEHPALQKLFTKTPENSNIHETSSPPEVAK